MNKYELESVRMVEEMLKEVFGKHIIFPLAKPLKKDKKIVESEIKIKHLRIISNDYAADYNSYTYW